MTRNFEKLSAAHLRSILDWSREELTRFLRLAGDPPGKFRCYEQRLVAICLAQGAAQHWTDLEGCEGRDQCLCVSDEKIQKKEYRVLANGQVISGIKDIDIWFFFEPDTSVRISSWKHCRKESRGVLDGIGEFGIDFMKKEIPRHILDTAGGNEPREMIRTYLRDSDHGREHLAKKSVIGLFPESLFSQVLWCVFRERCADD